jgi:hypothetical protein
MEQVFSIAQQVAWPFAAVGVVGAIVAYVFARQIAKEREEIRTLRVSLEHNPSPDQVRQSLAKWPELASYPTTVQLGELVKRSNAEEGQYAQRKESALGYSRLFATLAVLGVAIIVVGMFWKP